MIARTANTFCSKIDWSSTSEPGISWVSNNHHQALTEMLTIHQIFICLSLTHKSCQTVIRFALYWNSTSSTPPQYLFDSPLYYKLRLTTVKFQRDNYNPCLAINLGAWKIVQSLVSLYCDYLSQNTTNYNNTLISALTPHISDNS